MTIILDNDLEKIAEDLDINIDNIVHFIILGGTEVVGEVIDTANDSNTDHSNDYLIANPIKVIRDFYISDEGEYHSQQLFTDWNPCADSPYIPLNSELIVSEVAPNDVTIRAYLNAVYINYYPSLINVDFVPDDESFFDDLVTDQVVIEKDVSVAYKQKSNVIDFMKHFKKKQ